MRQGKNRQFDVITSGPLAQSQTQLKIQLIETNPLGDRDE